MSEERDRNCDEPGAMNDTWAPGPHDRITASQHYGADEIMLSDVTVHLEDMGDWIHLLVHKPSTDLRITASIRPNQGGVAVVVTDVEGAGGLLVDPDAMELR